MEREGNSTGVGYPEMSKNMEEQMQFKETSYPLERETLVPRFFKVISSTVAEINPLLVHIPAKSATISGFIPATLSGAIPAT